METNVSGVTINAQSLTILSELNMSGTDPGAKATVGAGHDGSNSVDLHYAGGTANVALSDFRAVNRAVISGAAITLTGDLNLTVNSKSIAVASVSTGSSLGYYTAVLTVVKSYADGEFTARVNTGSRKVRAGNIRVINTYDSKATALSAVAAKGVSASLLSVGGNIAMAEAAPTAEAALDGEGGEAEAASTDEEGQTVVDGEVVVRVTGTGKATADFDKPTAELSIVGIAVNVVIAHLTGSQTAKIGQVDVTAGSLTMESIFNNGRSDVAAEALQGVGGQAGKSFKLSGLDISANTASAKANTQVDAIADGASFHIAGEMIARALGTAAAHAGIAGGSSVTLVGVGVMVCLAEASGSFKAELRNCGDVEAGSLSVTSEYTASAEAETTQPPSGITASLVGVNTNIATATVGAAAAAGVGGTGSLKVGWLTGGTFHGGAVTIQVTGTVRADASVANCTLLNVKAIDVSVNVVESHLSANQSAYLNMSGAESRAGAVTVVSDINNDAAYANPKGVNSYLKPEKARSKAVTGCPGGKGGASISLLSVGVNKALADSATVNSACLTGGTYTLDSLHVTANTVSSVYAFGQTAFSAGLVSAGCLESETSTCDEVKTIVTGAVITAAGDVIVAADGKTNANARTESGGSVQLANVSVANAKATIGKMTWSGGKPLLKQQSVSAGVHGGSVVSGGDVSVQATNVGRVESVIDEGINISGVSINSTTLPTLSYYNTEARVADHAVIKADGSIRVTTTDNTGYSYDLNTAVML